MNKERDRQIDSVRVIEPFPGFNVGDVLNRYYDDSFILHQDFSDEEFIEEDISWRLTEEQVMKYLGTYFEDISTYEPKNVDQIEFAIRKLKQSIENEEVNAEAVLVWKNLLYCLEWVLGRREYQIPYDNENVQKESNG
jgi:hypothetical protein